jgi:hypothetical protein
VINGIKVLFSDGHKVEAYILVAGRDTERDAADLVDRLASDGWYVIPQVNAEGKRVPFLPITNIEGQWVERGAPEPSLRQRLGMRPAWKLA